MGAGSTHPVEGTLDHLPAPKVGLWGRGGCGQGGVAKGHRAAPSLPTGAPWEGLGLPRSAMGCREE